MYNNNNNNNNFLSVATYNVWFDDFEFKKRVLSILNIVSNLSCDIICFQEVTQDFIEILNKSILFNDYNSSDINESGVDRNSSTCLSDSYGVLTLCKKIFNPNFIYYSLPTDMDRKLLVCEININNELEKVAIGNVHLESLNSHKLRMRQLKMCNEILNSYNNSIIMGDFNCCSYRNYSGNGKLENDDIKNNLISYHDTWVKLKDSNIEPGFTYDTKINTMLSYKFEQMRYDRIFYKSSSSFSFSNIFSKSNQKLQIQPINIEIIGNKKIKNDINLESVELSSPIAISPINRDFTTPLATPDKLSNDINKDNLAINNNVLPQQSVFDTPDVKKISIDLNSISNRDVFPSDHFGIISSFQLIYQ
jgi:endonuclease/exonuclease/phosphatase family metal-dependent hydrolase